LNVVVVAAAVSLAVIVFVLAAAKEAFTAAGKKLEGKE